MLDLEIHSFKEYAAQVSLTLELLPWEAIHRMAQVLHQARMSEKQVFIIGNGGSAATASHMACDLGKNTQVPGFPRFRVIALTDNMAFFSAWANDCGYENVFAEQLANFVRPADVVVAISTSGNSPNVLKAVELAGQHGAFTIGWTGYGGGKLAALVNLAVVVPNQEIELVEDVHLMLQHMVTKHLRGLAQHSTLFQTKPQPAHERHTNGLAALTEPDLLL